MKHLFTAIAIFSLIACNQSDKKTEHIPTTDSLNKETRENSTPDSIHPVSNHRKVDSNLLMSRSTEILKLIKARNYEKFAFFIHPDDSIRFSPYAYVDTTDNVLLSARQFVELVRKNKTINWESAREEEKPGILTVDKYFKRFVYDVDFLNAKFKSINDYHSQGTDLNNIEEVYPNCDIVEFFFPGFEEKYGGMDFRALRLVFKKKDNTPYLVGIVHDEWTP